MTALHTLPTADAVARLFGDLLGRRVSAKPCAAKVHVVPGSPGVFGLFGSDRVEALVYCDIALACYAGAALSLIPMTSVQSSVRIGSMAPGTFENLSEVLNVARSWFDAENVPQAKLLRVVASPCILPKDVAPLLQKATDRIELEVDISGYGAGKMMIVVR